MHLQHLQGVHRILVLVGAVLAAELVQANRVTIVFIIIDNIIVVIIIIIVVVVIVGLVVVCIVAVVVAICAVRIRIRYACDGVDVVALAA